MPKLSIIIPIYNTEKYLMPCLDSILNQTYKDYELILIDDGSSDSSGEICDSYACKDSRIKVIHKKGSGVSAARNTGMNAATGKYLMFCDGDDCVNNHWCEIMINEAEKYPESIIVCDIIRTDNTKKVALEMSKSENVVKGEYVDYFTLYSKWLSAYVWNKIYNRELIEKNSVRFDENRFLGEDVVFNCDYLNKTGLSIRLIDAQLYYYYQNSLGAVHKYYQNFMELNLQLFALRIQLITEEKIPEFCDSMLFNFIHMLDSVWDERNNMSFVKKLKYNNRMLNSQEVRFCFKHATWINESKILKAVLSTHNYYFYYIFRIVIRARKN